MYLIMHGWQFFHYLMLGRWGDVHIPVIDKTYRTIILPPQIQAAVVDKAIFKEIAHVCSIFYLGEKMLFISTDKSALEERLGLLIMTSKYESHNATIPS